VFKIIPVANQAGSGAMPLGKRFLLALACLTSSSVNPTLTPPTILTLFLPLPLPFFAFLAFPAAKFFLNSAITLASSASE
jgi:hypothetical protein